MERLGKTAVAVLAIAAAAPVYAQDSVTLYGVADIGLLYTSKTANKVGQNGGAQVSLAEGPLSASRVGLRGVEDLGGGLRTVFTLESGIDLANGGFANSNGNFFGRQVWVELDGGFGAIRAGLQYSPFVLALIATDARNISYFGSGAINYVNNVLATGLFNQNAISYTSPVLGGFQGSAMFGLGGKAGDFQSGRQYSVSFSYHAGGLMANAAYYNGNAGGATTTPIPSNVSFEGRTIGAAYTYGSLTVKGSFVNYKVSGSFDSRVFGGGLSWNVTPSFNVDGGTWVTSDGNNSSNHSVLGAIGTRYSLSKATALFGQVAVVNNHGKMNTGLAINNALFGVSGTTYGATVGIDHVF